MNTFLPYPDFEKSAQALDRKRLGKQRVEVLQLLRGGWPNHPASCMWQGYFFTLAEYGLAICRTWIALSYKDTCFEKIKTIQLGLPVTGMPAWLGNPEFHRAHQSNLIRKYPEHYLPLFPDVPNNLPYIWPK